MKTKNMLFFLSCISVLSLTSCNNANLIESGSNITENSVSTLIPSEELTDINESESSLEESEISFVESEVSTEESLVPHEHNYSVNVQKAASCEEDGLIVYECECGDTYQEVVDATGHNEVIDIAVESTCTAVGYTEGSHCDTCGKVFVAQEELPIIDHNYVDYVCDVCNDNYYTPGLSFTELENGTYEVAIGKAKRSKEIIIPSRYNGKAVTKIAHQGFSMNENIEKVYIPSGIRIIDENSFYYCESLEEVVLSEGLKEIKQNAFTHCTSLKSINIPSTVEKMSYLAFDQNSLEKITVSENNEVYDSRENCNAIIETAESKLLIGCANTVIPSDIEVIGEFSFSGNSMLTNINIPNNIIKIEGGAFNSCSALESIYISENVELIEYAFTGCSSLTSIVVNENNNVYDSRENCNALIETSSNTLLIGCGNTIIPTGIVALANSAFSGCIPLESIDIPEGVEVIGNSTFDNCYNLKSVTIPSTVKVIDDGAFWSCSALESVIIPEGVTRIGYGTFTSCSSLKKVSLPNSLTEIGDYSFHCCSSLATIEIPSNVTRIGNESFDMCALTSLSLPEGLTYIGYSAFSFNAFSSIYIPNSVRYIGDSAFSNCHQFKEINYGGSEEQWNNITFDGNHDYLVKVTVNHNYK